ncbi:MULTISPECIES: F0F1 ATP synthase subunit A [unclassified Paenibacillus]|uniref:F0F1 ATP synthase subunit A n=1 Tax=unclassified Paenibacillus TaxID=185978 RepID=UPI001AE1E280|nr:MULTISPECIES: F0F1 ATP synthase subunit A [unclassified Paenibacillus]MBP1153209.1 F-type H+-transporting ATPase subunit a [Paenibacillus sp. PvP091]MBP1171408.1 F-type H+-transporting ATPase subunit a [Paenibacillus sp. PvR098]MBP2442436.1 F-type H+-transporting ATPase subunit a [Paenibacillus sp. PvP052]
MHEFAILHVGGLKIDISTFLAIIVSCVIVFVVARLAVRNLSVTNPSKTQNFMEWVLEFVYNTIASTMPAERARPFVSLGMTLILFIFVSNLLGLPLIAVTVHKEPLDLFGFTIISQAMIDAGYKGEPGASVAWWKSPTADVAVTFGLATIVFLLVHILGLKLNRKHYIKHYFEPYWFFFPLNVIKEISKPLTLGLRLYANIFAGEVLIATILMAGIFGTPLLAAWQGFSVFIGAIQAFLFTVLTMVYISQATVHHDESHDHH